MQHWHIERKAKCRQESQTVRILLSPRMNTEENKSGVYFLGGLDIEIVYALKVRHSLRCYKKTLL